MNQKINLSTVKKMTLEEYFKEYQKCYKHSYEIDTVESLKELIKSGATEDTLDKSPEMALQSYLVNMNFYGEQLEEIKEELSKENPHLDGILEVVLVEIEENLWMCTKEDYYAY